MLPFLSVTIRGPRESRIPPVLTFDPNEPPVLRFTRGWKIDISFDQEFSDHYTRIHDSFPDLAVLAAHQLSDGTGTRSGQGKTHMRLQRTAARGLARTRQPGVLLSHLV